MLDKPLLFTGCSSIQFFNSPPFPYKVSQDTFWTLPLTVPQFCDLQDAMLRYWSPNTSNPTPSREAEDFSRGEVSYDCASAHILSLIGTNLINKSGLIFICVKIMNVLTCGEEISKLAV